MSAQIIAFPRKRPMAWEELPAYWGYCERSYYEAAIAAGVSHQEAFAEEDVAARMDAIGKMAIRLKDETLEDFLARYAHAPSPEEALKAHRAKQRKKAKA